jgi:GntR family transcriptional regulator/MocR family aminotransferase
MTIEWTGLSPELLIPLDRTSGEPLKRQLECGLRNAIRGGRLRAGERLPSTRELARALGVSRGLVVDCFDQLQAEGYLVSRAGSATRVAQTAQQATPTGGSREPTASALDVDFRPAVPDLGSFPRADWAWAMREVCRDASNSAFGYGDSRGADVLRTVLASYLNRVRGAAATVEQAIVCTGFSQGLNITLTALARLGVARVGFEDPGYDETGRIAADLAGVEMVAVPVDDDGIRVDRSGAVSAAAS